METNQFRQIIRTEYGYQSPARRLFLAQHLPGWRTFIYYSRIVMSFVIARLDGLRGKLTNERWLKASIKCLQAVESAGGRVHVSGLEAVGQHKGPLVYIANHMSVLETLILPSVTLAFNDVTFIIKDELRRYPIIGRVMKALNLIAVYRQNPREGVPVVPIALKTDFHCHGRWLKDFGPINPDLPLYFKFGELMPVTGNGHATHQRVVEFITQNLKQWGAEVKMNAEGGIRNAESESGKVE